MTTLVNSYRGLGAPAARSDAGDANLGLLGGIVMRLGGWLGEQRRYRQTVNELSALTDRELEDIGLSRGDIEGVAQRCVRNR
jgi:uncharacterized protein YjiS (DUF1127 family)